MKTIKDFIQESVKPENGKDWEVYVNNKLDKTWTIRDVNKRNVVKQNNLNYIEFWNIEELKNWINNGK